MVLIGYAVYYEIDLIYSINFWKSIVMYFMEGADHFRVDCWNEEREVLAELDSVCVTREKVKMCEMQTFKIPVNEKAIEILLTNGNKDYQRSKWFNLGLYKGNQHIVEISHYGKEGCIYCEYKSDITAVKYFIPANATIHQYKEKRGEEPMIDNKNFRVDLHMHSHRSDGTWSYEEIIKEIQGKGIQIFSITDHDLIPDTDRILTILKEKGETLIYVIGTEIGVTLNQKEYHITVYNFDPENKELKALLEENCQKREVGNNQVIKYVQELGLVEDTTDYEKYDYNLSRGGWKSLNYLLDKGAITDMGAYFDYTEKSGATVEFRHPAEVIKIAKEAGGTCFLAHPSCYKKGDLLPEEELDVWREMGIEGLECYSPYLADLEDAKYYINYCKKHNLQISSGSDCHGSFTKRELGSPEIKLGDIRLDF